MSNRSKKSERPSRQYKGWDKGWVDHRVNDGKAIHILETKLAKSDEKLRSKYIWSQWDEAIKQLSRISGSTRVAKLGGENGTVFKTAILFIPIFVKSKEEKGVKQKYPSYVDDIIYKNLETMLSSWNLKRKPDWIASWLLPKSLQYPWNDDKGDYLWHSPAVLIIAKLCDKWEKNDSEKWTRVMN